MSVALLAWLGACATQFPMPLSVPSATPPAPGAFGVVAFDAELATLWRDAACVGHVAAPALTDDPRDKHCAKLAEVIQTWRSGWYAKTAPFLRALVPADVPARVVYPFGGADLLTALTVYPAAREITILALEPAGDPRTFATLSPAGLAASLSLVRKHFQFLAHLNFSRTVDLDELWRGFLAGVLIYDLAALAVLDYEPVGLRFFTLGPTGGRLYFSPADLARIDAEAARQTTAKGRAKVLAQAFGDVELQFRKRPTPEDPQPPLQTFRHLSCDLEDPALRKDPRVLSYLDLQGQVAAMTKASSYLLWHTSFSLIRDWLRDHLVWMISDSTGLSPDIAGPAGLEQIPYGKFDGPLISHPRGRGKLMVELWTKSPERPLDFPFGYPSRTDLYHLLITRRAH